MKNLSLKVSAATIKASAMMLDRAQSHVVDSLIRFVVRKKSNGSGALVA